MPLKLQFKGTIGLMSAEEYQAAVDDAANANRALIRNKEEKERLAKQGEEERKKEREAKRKKKAAVLSFNIDEDENEEETSFILKNKKRINDSSDKEASTGAGSDAFRKKTKKNPSVVTDFLPDQERDMAIESEKQRLRDEWKAKQEEIKKDKLLVTYSYWDGSGHRKDITVTKGTTIGKFLQAVKDQLADSFRNIKNASADSLGTRY